MEDISAADDAPSQFSKATRFTLWETRARYYLVAYNTPQTRFRILKIDRTPRGHQGGQQWRDAAQSHQNDGTAATTSSRPPSSVFESKEDSAITTTNAQQPKTDSSASAKAAPSHKSSANTASISASNPASAAYWELGITADNTVYDRSQITEILDMVSDGNKPYGGLKEVGHFFGLVGFIRFTSTYHMVLISRRSVVALLGGHYIYHCDETKIIPVCHPSVTASLSGRTKAMDQEEARLLHTFKQVDLSKNFYFSYTYDLTRTLQENLTGRRFEEKSANLATGASSPQTGWGFSEKFVWNHHLLNPAFGSFEASTSATDGTTAHEWVLPLCYGFVDQAKLSVLNRTIHVTLIARRSRHFAGARFLKRGANEAGQVANDVETEQIVSEALTTPFYAPLWPDATEPSSADSIRRNLAQNPRFTSYVMHRGSIPIFWTQDSTNMSPRPPIEISVVDPFYSAAALHFDDMFARYGSPIIILNLIKSKEKTPRETKLLAAFGECVSYLNQFLPDDKKMIYVAWDMSRASKSHDQDVIGVLEDIAEETIQRTRFFHSGSEPTRFDYQLPTVADGKDEGSSQAGVTSSRRLGILTQTGVARVNCVDCLDRTNAAQFVIGKAAFGHQLHALGLLEQPYLPFDSDAVDMLTEMYHDLGDTIALQYGGSHLVNTMETYRKINQWTSHSRDMLEGLKRYYANSFVDADKQAAINLFLGIDEISISPSGATRPSTGGKSLTEAFRRQQQRRDYQDWYTPSNIATIDATPERLETLRCVAQQQQGFWAEYYRPKLFTDLMRHHAFKMTAVMQRQPRLPFQGHDAFRLPQSPSKRRHRTQKESISSLPTIPSSPTSASDYSPPAPAPSASQGSSSNAATASAVIANQETANTLVTSPFTSRYAHSRTRSSSRSLERSRLRTISNSSSGSTHSSATLVDSRSSAAPPLTPATSEPMALVGGVRRWMSLNHGNDADSSKRRRASAKRACGTEDVTGPDGTADEAKSIEQVGDNNVNATTPASIGNWLNPFVPALQTHPPATSLLEGWATPSVDAKEAREYASWIQQFRGDLALEPREPPWDLLLGQQTSAFESEYVKSEDAHLSDLDLAVYIKTVRRARPGTTSVAQSGLGISDTTSASAGEAQQSDAASASTHPLRSEGGQTLMHTDGQQQQHYSASASMALPAGSGARPADVDPILLNYASLASGGNAALGMHVGIKGASEAKVRAYRSWLNVGRRGA